STGFTTARAITLGDAASTFQIDSGQTYAASTAIGGTGALNKTGSGKMVLSAANTFSGGTNVSAGTLQITAANRLLTTGALTISGGTFDLQSFNQTVGSFTLTSGSIIGTGTLSASSYAVETGTISTIIGGSSTLTKSSSRLLILTGTSTFAGPITIGTDAIISAGGGTLNLTDGTAKNGTILTLTGGGTININGNGITGSLANSDLVVDGTTVVLNTANSYNGPTTVQNSGTLKLGASNVLPSSPQTAMSVNTSSVFDMASFSDGVASLAGDSTATVKNSVAGGTSTLTVNPINGVSTTFAGVIAGTN